LDGIVVSCGVLQEKVLNETTLEDYRVHSTPKAVSLKVLEDTTEQFDLDFFVVVSSISSVLGGLGFSAYSSSNTVVDTFVQEHNKNKNNKWLSVNWDGEATSDETKTIFSMLYGDTRRDRILVTFKDLSVQISDWIWKRDRTEGVKLNIDRAASHKDKEQMIIELWKAVLQIDIVTIDDSFFELGGNSLIGIKLIAQMRKMFKLELTIKDLFEHPTIREILNYMQEIEEGSYE